MKKLNSKGFTLVELLAVIIILAVIVAIAVPTVNNIIKESKQASLNDSAQLIVRTIENEVNIAALDATPATKLSTLSANWLSEYGAEYGYTSFSCTAGTASAAGTCTVEFGEASEGQFEGFTASPNSYTVSNPSNLTFPASNG